MPARKGSSWHRKNLRLLSGIPLIRYTLNASKISQPHDTLVTTDDPYIIEEANKFGTLIDERPENLCDDDATLDSVIYYIASNYIYDTYILLPPTSPLRNFTHVQEALAKFIESKTDSLVSVTQERKAIWKRDDDDFLRPIIERTFNRQLEQPCFISNGAIFISKRENILRSKKKLSGRTIEYLMSHIDSVDVHNEDDLMLADYSLKERA